ncbi:MAG: transketolase [Candidatus Paceibacterota bacterium]
MKENNLEEIAKLIRYYCLVSTTQAGSGHPTSSLSAADLMTELMFGGYFRFNLQDKEYANNDRLIFSKGHASPLYYALWLAAGVVSEQEMMSLREFKSVLEGHPSPRFAYTEAATGSLGQGLSVGAGMAMNAKFVDKLTYKTYVLLGDSEMAEGSVWEAAEIAAHYKLDNLIGIIDVNRLGQRGETLYGHDIRSYQKRLNAFNWYTIGVDGHNFSAIHNAFEEAKRVKDRPVMIIARTLKGKGVSFLEDQDGWHGKTLSQEELKKALKELGEVDKNVRGQIQKPEDIKPDTERPKPKHEPAIKHTGSVATRKAYGTGLVKAFEKHPNIISLDAEVSNSTYANIFAKAYPSKFFEMFIAEQNMVGVGLGFSLRGKIPFVSTFAAFLTRAFDQIRMSQYSVSNVKFVGSHAGVSIGTDGPSQMALEDLAMFRSLLKSVVLYPSDAVSTEKLVEAAAEYKGNVYIRTTRAATPVLYKDSDVFEIGGSKTLKTSSKDAVTVVAAGITLHEALKAHEALIKDGVSIRVIDLYSIKPLDVKTLIAAARETQAIITVEDHYPAGGIGEAVRAEIGNSGTQVYSLAVTKLPRSGKPEELLDWEEISAKAIVKEVKKVLKKI